jgi:hypothetical protein
MGTILGIFHFGMFLFTGWAYFIASYLLYHKYNNPMTDEEYTIEEIVQVTQCTIMTMLTAGMIVPTIPGITKGL